MTLQELRTLRKDLIQQFNELPAADLFTPKGRRLLNDIKKCQLDIRIFPKIVKP